MNNKSTLIALWTGELSANIDMLRSLAIHEITPESKEVMLKVLLHISCNATAIETELKALK